MVNISFINGHIYYLSRSTTKTFWIVVVITKYGHKYDMTSIIVVKVINHHSITSNKSFRMTIFVRLPVGPILNVYNVYSVILSQTTKL